MPSITIVKKFTYRGDTHEEWSSTYHFDNDAPLTQVKWKALADAVILAEKPCYPSTTGIIRATGHKAGVNARDFIYDYEAGSGVVAGTLATPGVIPQAGDAAAWLRWATSQVTSKGKPIYLRSYFHDVYANGNTRANVDTLLALQKTNLETYGAAWITGFSDGVVTHHRAGPNGAIALAPSVASTYVTTRTLERRGRRRPL
jgi:putative intracellular protease/amidase